MLTSISASQVHAAAAQKAPLNNKLEETLKANQVVCFVRYKEKEFKGKITASYPLVALYTTEDFYKHNIHVEIVQDAIGQSTPARAAIDIENSRVMNPTPITVVAEGSASTSLQKTPALVYTSGSSAIKTAYTTCEGGTVSAKRSLAFTTEPKKKEVAEKKSEFALPLSGQTGATTDDESERKKMIFLKSIPRGIQGKEEKLLEQKVMCRHL